MKVVCAIWVSIAVFVFITLDDCEWGERIGAAIVYGGIGAAVIVGLVFVWGWALA